MASDTASTGTPGTDLRDADREADREGAVTGNGRPASMASQPNGRGVLRPAEARLLERDLAAAVDGEVRFDAGTRGAYSTDASNYRQVPIGVVVPAPSTAAVAAVEVCRRHGVPLLSRGGGTSLAGQCTNTAVVIDWSKYCNRLVSVDAERAHLRGGAGHRARRAQRPARAARARVRAGAGHPHHCTLGGMIGNNSCGATAQRTGKVVDNIAAPRGAALRRHAVVGRPDQRRRSTRADRAPRWPPRARSTASCASCATGTPEQIRARYPHIPRRVSGYNLDSLLPEHGFDVARAARRQRVDARHRAPRRAASSSPRCRRAAWSMLGYPDVVASRRRGPGRAARADPIALEGLDGRLDRLRARQAAQPEGPAPAARRARRG